MKKRSTEDGDPKWREHLDRLAKSPKSKKPVLIGTWGENLSTFEQELESLAEE